MCVEGADPPSTALICDDDAPGRHHCHGEPLLEECLDLRVRFGLLGLVPSLGGSTVAVLSRVHSVRQRRQLRLTLLRPSKSRMTGSGYPPLCSSTCHRNRGASKSPTCLWNNHRPSAQGSTLPKVHSNDTLEHGQSQVGRGQPRRAERRGRLGVPRAQLMPLTRPAHATCGRILWGSLRSVWTTACGGTAAVADTVWLP